MSTKDREIRNTPDTAHHVVIVGGGFGGLYAANALAGKPVRVTLIDRRNHHLFQPLLYQVATGGLSPAHIAHPLRSIFSHAKNVRVVMDEVQAFDADNKRIVLSDGDLEYDTLIVAAGATSHYFGNDQWESRAPSLKSIDDATRIRQRILSAFEAAEKTDDPIRRRTLLTFAVVGAGPTGVELAGTLGEIANYTLREDFRNIDPRDAEILLIEGGSRILPTYRSDLAERAERDLADLGVTVLTETKVEDLTEERLSLKSADGVHEVCAHTVLWAAGVKASPLAGALAESTGAETDGAGRLLVTRSLHVPGYDEVFVIGDMAHFENDKREPLPGVAPVAMQQGAHVAKTILDRLKGRNDTEFRYRDRGSMATIGRSRAIAEIGQLGFGGTPAWVAWLFVHLLYLVAFENRVLVLTQWAWNYATWNRGARLITEAFGYETRSRSGADSGDDETANAA